LVIVNIGMMLLRLNLTKVITLSGFYSTWKINILFLYIFVLNHSNQRKRHDPFLFVRSICSISFYSQLLERKARLFDNDSISPNFVRKTKQKQNKNKTKTVNFTNPLAKSHMCRYKLQQCSMSSFYACRSQKRKEDWQLDSLFYAFGICARKSCL